MFSHDGTYLVLVLSLGFLVAMLATHGQERTSPWVGVYASLYLWFILVWNVWHAAKAADRAQPGNVLLARAGGTTLLAVVSLPLVGYLVLQVIGQFIRGFQFLF